jgi:hypothetical protein
MYNKTNLKAGTYFIGDLSKVLDLEDLKDIFTELYHNGKLINTGLRKINKSSCMVLKNNLEKEMWENFWVVNAPYKSGTLYDKLNNGYGFDFGIFGCIETKHIFDFYHEKYINEVQVFNKDFVVYSTDTNIVIGDIILNFN